MSAAVYDIPVRRIDGTDSKLGDFAGSVLLVVNVASACGLTPQYAGLEQVYETYHGKGFEVLGFPANDFAAQEPGTNDEIKSFCETKFGVKFPMFEKITVKGTETHPLYQTMIAAQPKAQASAGGELLKRLTEYGLAPANETDVMWNFEKFLVDRSGKVVGRFAPDIAPDDPVITGAIEKALSA